MISINDNILTTLNAPARQICGRVELYNGNTLLHIFNSTDNLKNLTVERQGAQGKYFGFAVSHKLIVKLVDRNREINVDKGNTLEVELGATTDLVYFCPFFVVTEVKRDENTNELTITAQDMLYMATGHTVSELDLPATGYTLAEFVGACAGLLGLPFRYVNINDDVFSTYYEGGANFDGAESISTALAMVAEATQTIVYIGHDWELTFKRLDKDGGAVFAIDKSKYFNLKCDTAETLTTITHCTELGDNVTATTGAPGATQYVRNNAFWDMRADIDTIVENAVAAVGGTTLTPYDCEWRGNFAVEIGDKVELITKDNASAFSFILSDTLTYNGALSQKTAWSYSESKSESPANPSSLGEALFQTFAKVDKVEKQIDIVASESTSNSAEISKLHIDTSLINASVENLNSKVNAQMTAEEIQISIKKAVENDVKKVVTETGFTFDSEGLRVSKAGTEMSTQITDNGMTVYKNKQAVLVADNLGVKAEDLHATTFLIIGNNSRLEDYNGNRTGCFWIGR